MFKKMDKRRLMELAGIELPKEVKMNPHDSDSGLHGEQPMGGDDEPTEEHVDKETEVFQSVHDALEKLLDFLHNQEGFEEKRGKDDEYAQMEQDASDLKEVMKKHLSGYEGSEGDEDHDEDSIRMVKPSDAKPNKMSFR